jgi:hypothetical protein
VTQQFLTAFMLRRKEIINKTDDGYKYFITHLPDLFS